jgi:trk system potassium uptake protein TrkA
MVRRLLPVGGTPEFRDASGVLVLVQVPVHLGWVGRRVRDLETASGGRVAYLTRLGEGVVPGADTVYQEGDLVHAMVRESDLPRAERVLAARPGTEG